MVRFVHRYGIAVVVLSAICFQAAAAADLQGRSVTSVEKRADGYHTARIENTTFIPYAVFNAADSSYAMRIATLVTRFKFATGQEPAPFDATVSVSIDDLSGGTAKRLAAFTDPGAEGRILADRYFVTTQTGCCAELFIHHVRLLETGKLLFHSTGREAGHGMAWMEAPNTPLRRWAAVDGKVSEAEWKKGILGRVRYGGDNGALSVVEIEAPPDSELYQDLSEGLGQATVLLWADRNRKPGASTDDQPSSGEAGSPHIIWSLDGVKDAAKLGGFELVLRAAYEPADAEPFARIPVEADRLRPEMAVAVKGLVLTSKPE